MKCEFNLEEEDYGDENVLEHHRMVFLEKCHCTALMSFCPLVL